MTVNASAIDLLLFNELPLLGTKFVSIDCFPIVECLLVTFLGDISLFLTMGLYKRVIQRGESLTVGLHRWRIQLGPLYYIRWEIIIRVYGIGSWVFDLTVCYILIVVHVHWRQN